MHRRFDFLYNASIENYINNYPASQVQALFRDHSMKYLEDHIGNHFIFEIEDSSYSGVFIIRLYPFGSDKTHIIIDLHLTNAPKSTLKKAINKFYVKLNEIFPQKK